MTTDRIERRLPEILTEISWPQVPDYLDDILSQTARTRQRPGWSLPERWLPVDIAVQPVRTGRVPWRVIGALVLLLLALAAAIAIYVGFQPHRAAPLFGPAANGSILFDRNGDIFVADADARSERLLIGGRAHDHAEQWSNNGSTIFFGRDVTGGTAVMAADADGGHVRQASTKLVGATDAVSLSPDGTELAVINIPPQRQTLGIHALDGVSAYRDLDLGAIKPARFVGWRPPNGDELIFEGYPGGDETQIGLYGIRPDGTGLRLIALQHHESVHDPLTQVSFQGMEFSDDGREAAYWNWEPSVRPGKSCFVHVIDLTTGLDRRMSYDPTARCEVGPTFLADGRILLHRQDIPAGGQSQLLVGPVDGSAEGTRIGPIWPTSDWPGWVLSPDRAEVLFIRQQHPSQLLSIESGRLEDAAVEFSGDVSWQRLAPNLERRPAAPEPESPPITP